MTYTDQRRRDYQKKYYRAHKAKALAYQREYTKINKKRGTPKDKNPWLGESKRCFSMADLTQAPTARFERQLNLILSGQMGFTKL